jgi:BirA family biotin operon repressor/biotin-[acetyl-CoA-carboxylase] ligase
MFKILYFSKLKSTFDKAYEINSVIVADVQTKGKGRFERSWSSSKGGIYMSIVLETFDASYLTFIAAISVCKAIKEVYGVKTIIKWPNDLIYNNKKLCGVLTKVSDKSIIGIGVNTNNKIPKSLSGKAISLSEIINKKVNNKKIIEKLLKYFEDYLKLLKNKKYSKIIKDWKRNSFLGSRVRVKSLGKTYSGIAHDVDKDCFLVIKSGGEKIVVREGDVMVEQI